MHHGKMTDRPNKFVYFSDSFRNIFLCSSRAGRRYECFSSSHNDGKGSNKSPPFVSPSCPSSTVFGLVGGGNGSDLGASDDGCFRGEKDARFLRFIGVCGSRW